MLKTLIFVSALSLAAAPAFADTVTETFSFTGVDIVVTGTSTATPGEYLLSGISGTTDGSTVASIIPAGEYPNNPGPPSDNLIFDPEVDGGYLDENGISYTLVNGEEVNLYYIAPAADTISGYFTDIDNDVTAPSNNIPINATPEPGSLALAGTGILGMAGILRRRFAR